MKYKYFKPIELTEHLYFVDEILELCRPILPIGTVAKDLHKIIKDYAKKFDLELEPLYYQINGGVLKRVYPVDMALMAVEYHVSNLTRTIKEERNEYCR